MLSFGTVTISPFIIHLEWGKPFWSDRLHLALKILTDGLLCSVFNHAVHWHPSTVVLLYICFTTECCWDTPGDHMPFILQFHQILRTCSKLLCICSMSASTSIISSQITYHSNYMFSHWKLTWFMYVWPDNSNPTHNT